MGVARTYRGVPAEVRRAERHGRLIEATIGLWGSEDSHVTMTAVCQTAHLTERYFYESFANLEAALVAAVDYIADLVESATVAKLAHAPADPIQRIGAMVEAFASTLLTDRRLGRAALIEAQAYDGTRLRREVILRRFARLAAREARKVDGPAAWSKADGPLRTTMFVGGVVQLVTSALVDIDAPSIDKIRNVSQHAFRVMIDQPELIATLDDALSR